MKHTTLKTDNQAVFATAIDSRGEQVTVRVGKPTAQHIADARWLRLDDRRIDARVGNRPMPVVHHNRRQYTVQFFEVRTTDRHGRGLGSERHWNAQPTKYIQTRSGRKH